MKKDNPINNQSEAENKVKINEAELYDEARQILEANTERIELYKKAQEMLEQISGYKNSAKLLQQCNDKILALGLKRDNAKRKKKKMIRNIILGVSVVVIALLAVSAVSTQNSANQTKYNDAIQDLEDAKNPDLTDKERNKLYRNAYKVLADLGHTDVVFNNRLDRVKAFADQAKYVEAFQFLDDEIYSSNAILTIEMMNSIAETETYIATKIKEDADAKLAAKDYYGALDLYRYLNIENEDVAKGINMCQTEAFKTAKVMDVVRFGTYEITCKSGDFDEDIEWYVLAKDGNKYLLVSKYVIDAHAYNSEYVDVTWDKSSIRTWLNGKFAEKAFNEAELSSIVATSIDTNGAKTSDKVFLLSKDEVGKYFTKAPVTENSKYAVLVGASGQYDEDEIVNTSTAWWLRDTVKDTALTVDELGEVYTENGHFVTKSDIGVRPAVWVTID